MLARPWPETAISAPGGPGRPRARWRQRGQAVLVEDRQADVPAFTGKGSGALGRGNHETHTQSGASSHHQGQAPGLGRGQGPVPVGERCHLLGVGQIELEYAAGKGGEVIDQVYRDAQASRQGGAVNVPGSIGEVDPLIQDRTGGGKAGTRGVEMGGQTRGSTEWGPKGKPRPGC